MTRSFQTTLAAQYSTVFATGLLARSSLDKHTNEYTDERSSTSTPGNSHSSEESRSSSQHRGTTRGLRKRRSSLTVATSSVPVLKAHHARQSLLLRARSGSLNESGLSALFAIPATDAENQPLASSPPAPTLMNRMRSGSLGGALRAGARRLVRKAPTAPPSMPLPPLPSQALALPTDAHAVVTSAPPTQTTFAAAGARRPLAPRGTHSALSVQIALGDSTPTGDLKIADFDVFASPPATPIGVSMDED